VMKSLLEKQSKLLLPSKLCQEQMSIAEGACMILDGTALC
jgi:hypothetical protein